MIRVFFRFIVSAFFWLCAFMGFLILTLVLVFYFNFGIFKPKPKPLHKEAVLSITLNGQYVEHTNSKGFKSLFLGKDASLYELTRAISEASKDEKIKGLLVQIEAPTLGTAQIQELRDALLTFRKTGKPSWCYADTFGESSSGTGLYYLATACQEIWLQPMGGVNLIGINLELPFGKDAFEKLDVKPEISQWKEYKSFVEMFTRDGFSEASREALQAIADSISSQIVEGIAKDRNIPHEQVRELIENGPYLTQEAMMTKLVDRLDYRQNLKSQIQAKLGQSISFRGVNSYLETLQHEVKGDKVALIFGSGVIQRDGGDSLLDEVAITSDATYKAFQLAIEDKDVKAIVYRVNSEGGSPIASETIYGIINYTKDHAKKPVIISMSDAAASGGYWISVAGTKIVAQPATLTGSIGVFGGKFVLSGLFEKLGVKWGQISTSENANMWSISESFTPTQWIKLNANMSQIYEGFTSRVAKGRKMSPEQVEKVARGRVWTGEQALALGLVDQLGGIPIAIELAKKEAGLPLEARVQVFPLQKPFLESLISLFDKDEKESLHEVGIFGSFLTPLKRIGALIHALISSQEVLYAPVGEVK